jgi:hypothetical protein
VKYCYLEQAERENTYQVCVNTLELFTLSLPLLILASIIYLIYQDRKERIMSTLARCERIFNNVE